jgi:hypothetical protein
MTTIVEINHGNPQAGPLLEYLASLPFATLKKGSQQSFKEAAMECNAVPVSEFTAELHRQIDEHFDKLGDA